VWATPTRAPCKTFGHGRTDDDHSAHGENQRLESINGEDSARHAQDGQDPQASIEEDLHQHATPENGHTEPE